MFDSSPVAPTGVYRASLLLSGIVLVLVPVVAFADGAAAHGPVCEVRFLKPQRIEAEQIAEWERMAAGLLNPPSLQIRFQIGPGLTTMPDAVAALEAAADEWESLLRDGIYVDIDIDMEPMGDGVLGWAASAARVSSYGHVRDLLVEDASDQERPFVGRLPSPEDLRYIHPRANEVTGDVILTRANYRALVGVVPLAGTEDPDVTIRFNSDYTWDFDADDGITLGTIDFRAVALHEIGHGLGFISGIDVVDDLVATGSAEPIAPWVLDLFRLRPGDGAGAFSTSPRILTPGRFEPLQVFFDGRTETLMSTALGGDGRQASHLKDDRELGIELGVMDPTASRGYTEELSAAELRMFSLIGWNVVFDEEGNPVRQTAGDDASADTRSQGPPDGQAGAAKDGR